MESCTTGVLVVWLDALEGPMRLLAGAAEAVAARMMDMAAANKLMIRVVFMMWFLLIGRCPTLGYSLWTVNTAFIN